MLVNRIRDKGAQTYRATSIEAPPIYFKYKEDREALYKNKELCFTTMLQKKEHDSKNPMNKKITTSVTRTTKH